MFTFSHFSLFGRDAYYCDQYPNIGYVSHSSYEWVTIFYDGDFWEAVREPTRTLEEIQRGTVNFLVTLQDNPEFAEYARRLETEF